MVPHKRNINLYAGKGCMFGELFAGVNALLQEALRQVLPSNGFTDFLIGNAFGILTVLAALIVLAFLLVAFFFDFITDVWKIPFAIGVDLLKYWGLFNPYAAVAGAVIGAVIFIFLSDAKFMKWPFALISVASCLVVLPQLWGGLVVGVLIALTPINTMMMFISTIID